MALDLNDIRRGNVAERDYWIDQLVMEVKRLREKLADTDEAHIVATGGPLPLIRFALDWRTASWVVTALTDYLIRNPEEPDLERLERLAEQLAARLDMIAPVDQDASKRP